MTENITRDEIENVLIDGEKSDILALRCPDCHGPIEYVYSERFAALDVICSCQRDHLHGLPERPNCVKFFGNRHIFA